MEKQKKQPNRIEEHQKNPLSPFEENLLDELKSKGHSEELVDHYWGSINYVLGLIRASEVKAGLILTFYGILLNFIFQQLGLLMVGGPKEIVIYILLGAWFLCTATSIYFSIRCFMPRLEGNYDKNVFYFGDVITKFGSIKEFSKTFYTISLNEEELFDQLGQQIFIISKIAALKFKYVNRSLRFLAFSLLIFLVLAICYAVLTLSA